MTTTSKAITEYVSYRQAAGADFRPTARLLHQFCRAVGPDVPIADVGAERVRAFVDGQGPVTRYWHRKHSALHGFYRYALSHRLVAHVPLCATVAAPPAGVPYLFTRDEVRRLLEATTAYRTTRGHLLPHTLRALLLLLYGAGLRLGEALHLTLADVDLTEALLTHSRHEVLQDTAGATRSRSLSCPAPVCGATPGRHRVVRRRVGVSRGRPGTAAERRHGAPRLRAGASVSGRRPNRWGALPAAPPRLAPRLCRAPADGVVSRRRGRATAPAAIVDVSGPSHRRVHPGLPHHDARAPARSVSPV